MDEGNQKIHNPTLKLTNVLGQYHNYMGFNSSFLVRNKHCNWEYFMHSIYDKVCT